ncbi:MAG TPA: DNA polymerase III subunit alpha [Firmicutes bacterium]|nr:DNA polymerase III subunit alpha [Bacillota bacterium]
MFVPLHIHSEYSLSKSSIKIEALVKKARSLGYTALALTDHNTMGGLVEFYRACRRYDLEPILGLELDLKDVDGCASMVLLAESNVGYQNLLKLASAAKPVDRQTLSQSCAGLIGVATITDLSLALEAYQQLAAVFAAANLFVELPIDGSEKQDKARQLAQILPAHTLVAAQNLYCLEAKDQDITRVLWQGSSINRPLPLLAPDEACKLCSPWPEAIKNTELIASRCNVELKPKMEFPQLPEEFSLRELALAGAKKRYGRLDPLITERLESELSVIETMGFSNYFLIVWDIVRFAKEAQIPVGPGRGSAAGCLVAYSLGITEVDPIAHNLLFERFLNRQRRNLPDIDLDICYQRREEVINYIIKRFGKKHVARIGTYGTYGHKSAENEIIRICGKSKPELVQQLIGLKQYFSTHAAGVIITPKPVTSYSGVEEVDGTWVTQLAMDDLAFLGVLKIDFLSLRTLTILKDIELLVQETDPGFKLEDVPFSDRVTFDLLQQGLTLGIFQVESQLFQELLPQIKPNSFADLVATLALVRPGPLKQIPLYIRRKEGLAQVNYLHPKLATILGETYGLMVYQEQVMQVAHEIAGLSLEEADLLRVAISRKDHSAMQQLRSKFITGCQQAGLNSKASRELYLQIDRFADYAFNKAHSTAYAVITWQMAYLKANYPIQFYIGLLKHTTDMEKLGDIYHECQLRGIRILPPDIRFSGAEASMEADALRIGFGNLKHIGQGQAQVIVSERTRREFASLTDLFARVELHQQTKLALAYGGALDCFGDRRRILTGLQMEKPEPGILGELALLEKEKEIVGIYLSGHPVHKWEGFLNGLKASLGSYKAGYIRHVRETDRQCSGVLAGDRFRCRFMLPTSSHLWHDLVREGELVALFGKVSGNQIEVEWVLPLKPLLMLVPKPERIVQLKDLLIKDKGSTPVIFSLGQGVIQLIDPRLWVDPKPETIDAIASLVDYLHWIDPWQSRVLDANMELTKGKYLAGGQMTWNTNL